MIPVLRGDARLTLPLPIDERIWNGPVRRGITTLPRGGVYLGGEDGVTFRPRVRMSEFTPDPSFRWRSSMYCCGLRGYVMPGLTRDDSDWACLPDASADLVCPERSDSAAGHKAGIWAQITKTSNPIQ